MHALAGQRRKQAQGIGADLPMRCNKYPATADGESSVADCGLPLRAIHGQGTYCAPRRDTPELRLRANPSQNMDPKTTPAPRGLASTQEACAFIGLCRISIFEHTSAGHLRCVRLGRAVRYPWSELERVSREGLPALPKRHGAPAATAPAQAIVEGQPPKRGRGRPRKSACLMGQTGGAK